MCVDCVCVMRIFIKWFWQQEWILSCQKMAARKCPRLVVDVVEVHFDVWTAIQFILPVYHDDHIQWRWWTMRKRERKKSWSLVRIATQLYRWGFSWIAQKCAIINILLLLRHSWAFSSFTSHFECKNPHLPSSSPWIWM